MKLPNNSVGISDAKQFNECPKLFFHSMRRHTGIEPEIYTGYSHILAYGQALHEGAEYIVRDVDNAYLDDVVDFAWAKWGRHLTPEHHKELREDLKTVLDRSVEADNLELVACEEDMAVPVYLGRSKDGALDEQKEWYKYRFRIDALYKDKDDPGHFIIRDFKTVRRRKLQSQIDSEKQFTAYDYGVRELYGNEVKKVTIWYDQVKFDPLFTTRSESDRMDFEEWIRSQIIAMLDMPENDVANTPRLNKFCGWCPLLESCEIVPMMSAYALAEVSLLTDRISPDKSFEDFLGDYYNAKDAMKALKAFTTSVEKTLKDNPGVHGGREWYHIPVKSTKISARAAFEILGEEIFETLPDIAVSSLPSELVDGKEAAIDLVKTEKIQSERLSSRPTDS